MQLFEQTQTLISGFLEANQKSRSERQTFYDFIAAEADRLSDADYNGFQAEVIGLLQRYKKE